MNVKGVGHFQNLVQELHGEASCGSFEKTGSNQREDLRYRVLRLLERNPHMSHRQIAQALGGSTGAVNYCINALIEKGMIKVKNFRSNNNKLRYAYILTPEGLNEKAILTVSFLRRKIAEYNAIESEISEILAELDINSDEPAVSSD